MRSSGTTAAVARSIADATGDLSIFEHLVVLGIGLFGTYFAARGLMKTLARVNAGAWRVPMVKPASNLRAVGIVLGDRRRARRARATSGTRSAIAWGRSSSSSRSLWSALIYGALIVAAPRPAAPARSTRRGHDWFPAACSSGSSSPRSRRSCSGYIARKLSQQLRAVRRCRDGDRRALLALPDGSRPRDRPDPRRGAVAPTPTGRRRPGMTTKGERRGARPSQLRPGATAQACSDQMSLALAVANSSSLSLPWSWSAESFWSSSPTLTPSCLRAAAMSSWAHFW